jgi:hypothetical protein
MQAVVPEWQMRTHSNARNAHVHLQDLRWTALEANLTEIVPAK